MLYVDGEISETYNAKYEVSGYENLHVLFYETEAETEYAYNQFLQNKNIDVTVESLSAAKVRHLIL